MSGRRSRKEEAFPNGRASLFLECEIVKCEIVKFTSMECYFQAKKFGRVGMIPSTCYLEYKETES